MDTETLTAAHPGGLPGGPRRHSSLSGREQQIVELLCQGMSDKEIAGDLEIAPYTVTNHLRQLYRRFGVRNRTQLVVRLLQ
jgi:DNA-binding CsgD family transcriptional regulator